jgi:hypothetical protein
MKNLRQLSVALVFIFALAMPAFAGDIETGIAPPTASAHITQGDIETPITGQAEEATAGTGSVTQAALNLLQSVLSLF